MRRTAAILLALAVSAADLPAQEEKTGPAAVAELVTIPTSDGNTENDETPTPEPSETAEESTKPGVGTVTNSATEEEMPDTEAEKKMEDTLLAEDSPDDGFALSPEEMALLEEVAALETETTGTTTVDVAPSESPEARAEVGIVTNSATFEEASPLDIGGHVGVEYQQFFKSPLDSRQGDFNFSLVINPELSLEWEGEKLRNVLNFSPFYRLDQEDDERSHFDVRELNLLTVADRWNMRVGAGKVFWGATETVHWVDIINQTDFIENLDGEDKLGQPMVNLNLNTKLGTFSLFALPYFRERTFPGPDGRPRTIPRIDEDNPIYESSAEEWHTDFAARWSKTFGDLDLGLSYFYGTAREPDYVPALRGDEIVLHPLYEIIHQGGLDATYTIGDWLFKLESVYRSGQGDEDFFMFAGGFEYTFYKIFGTQADLGLISEMLYDTRGNNVLNPYEKDLAAGFRLALNDIRDTELLFVAITDLDDGSTTLSLESSMRFGEHWKLVVEGRGFAGIPDDDFPLNGFRNDHYLQVGLEYHF